MEAPYPALDGFHNATGTSCFVDSVVLAIIAPYIVFYNRAANTQANKDFNKGAGVYRNSDGTLGFTLERFIDGLVREKQYTRKVCSDNAQTDATVRLNIRFNLIDSYNKLKTGESQAVCTSLRTELGRYCRLTGREVDFSTGQHDVNDVYSRLLSAMEFYPMTVRYLRQYTNNSNDVPYQSLSEPDNIAQYYVGVESTHGQLLGNWTTVSDVELVNQGTTYNRMSETILFERVNTLVVYLDRIVNGAFDARNVSVDPTVSLCVKNDGYNAIYQTYTLLSFVYRAGKGTSIDAGHFAAMVVVPTARAEFEFTQEPFTYYDYDDLQPKAQRVTRKEFFDIASSRGVLFFYFPYGAQGQPCEQQPGVNAPQQPLKRARVDQLVEAGYDLERAQAALQQANGDINEAFHLLMEGN